MKINKNKIIIGLAVVIIWQLISSMNIYSKALFPGIIEILKAIIDGFISGDLLNSIGYSFYILIKGIVLTLIIAIVLVIGSHKSVFFNDVVEFLITIAHPLPGIAIIPLVILWIGLGENAILFIIIHSMVWPMVLNLKEGVNSINTIYLDVSQVFNFTTIQKLKDIYFMGILPNLITGLKIAWSRGWRALISSEMIFGVIGSSSGLGWYIFEQRVYMNTPGLYGGLFIIIILGLLVESLFFHSLEQQTIKQWRL